MLYQVTHFLCCISTHDLTRRSTEEGDMCSLLNTFQLTTSRGGRLDASSFSPISMTFQLTTSRGGRPLWLCHTLDLIISTHDLTRRSTAIPSTERFKRSISTHDLTRRSTQSIWRSKIFKIISTHDLTRRSTVTVNTVCISIYISTHDLTRRSTHVNYGACTAWAFQLTTSRGGRHP